MNQRFLKWTTVVGAIALVSGSVVLSANAHIGASHSPFTTEGPDIRTATIDGDDISFCFDEEVSAIPGAASAFQVEGYDSSAEVDGTSKNLGSADECVEIGFPHTATDEDLVVFTIASLDAGAVEDRSGNENIESSVALEGGTRADPESTTDAPNLIEFEVDDGSDRITYIFDQNVTCAVNGQNFGFYTAAGNPDTATPGGGREDGQAAVVDCDPEGEVEVQFDGTPGVNDADRVFVEEAAICGVGVSAGKCNAPEAEGGTTDDPDLTGAERTDDDEWTWHFDEEVDTPVQTNFFLVGPDGTLNPVTGACSVEDDTDVACTFPNLKDVADEEIALATVKDGGVTDDDATAEANTIGDVTLNAAVSEEGLSDGPDLETCALDTTENIGTFQFDEPIEPKAGIVAATLDVFDADGNMSDGSSVEDAEEEEGTLQIEFDDDAIADAVGCHVDNDAVEDTTSNGSPRAAVGTGAAPSASPSTTTTTTTTTTTSTTTDQPREQSVSSTITIAVGRTGFEGVVRSRNAGCERRRQVTVKKRRAGNVGTDTTDRGGKWKIRKRVRRGTYYAVAARKVFTRGDTTFICTKATSSNKRRR